MVIPDIVTPYVFLCMVFAYSLPVVLIVIIFFVFKNKMYKGDKLIYPSIFLWLTSNFIASSELAHRIKNPVYLERIALIYSFFAIVMFIYWTVKSTTPSE